MVGTMAHPLNRARFDRTRAASVTEGYGILQPRVAVSLPGAEPVAFRPPAAPASRGSIRTRASCRTSTRISSAKARSSARGSTTSTPSSRAVGDRFPENRILSHDLIEGCYARAGLFTDVQLYEEYPSRYDADVQPAPSLDPGRLADCGAGCCPACPGRDGRRSRNPLSALSRWKIFDNLRRSLAPAAADWLARSPGGGCFRRPGRGRSPGWRSCCFPGWSRGCRACCASRTRSGFGSTSRRPPLARRQLAQAGLTLACLPHEAYFSLTAIVRTARRLLVTRRKLLEWTPSRDHGSSTRLDLAGSCARMWFAPALAIGDRRAVCWRTDRPLWRRRAYARCCGWRLRSSRWWISRPLTRRAARLSVPQTSLPAAASPAGPGPSSRRSSARTTTGCRPTTSRRHPAVGVAHRTSPTNMGLALLANLSACDFGYISAGRFLDRTSRRIPDDARHGALPGPFLQLVRHASLTPLRAALRLDGGQRQPRRPSADAEVWPAGHARRADRCPLASSRGCETRSISWSTRSRACRLRRCRDSARRSMRHARHFRRRWSRAGSVLERVAAESGALAATLPKSEDAEARGWASALEGQCREIVDDLASLAPWTSMPASARPHAHLPGFSLGADARRTRGARRRVGGRPRGAASPQPTALAAQSVDLAEMECELLVRRDSRTCCAIGYNVSDRRLDSSFYDLLASEARLCQLRRHRAGHAAAGALVRTRAPADDRGRRAGAAVVERLDVRVPDAAAGHAKLRGHAARRDLQARSSGARSSTARRAACRGASPSPATTPPTCPRPISTGRSACRGWGSSAAWPTTWSSRRTRPRWR